jgi:4-hydroxy-3-polyprenylbenzoate decarboxylase
MSASRNKRRLVLALTGASGMPYAVRVLEALAATPGIETHLILSNAARKVLALESQTSADQLAALAHACYREEQIEAGPASGSWRHAGMLVCPCSMASLAAIANGLGTNLIHRAADVTLKERRPLVLVVRETPFNQIHLRNMLAAAQAGAVILPASPGFYHKPRSIAELVDQLAARILDQFGVEHALGKRWAEEER